MSYNIEPCFGCKQSLRYPTDRGNIFITCPSCRQRHTFVPDQESWQRYLASQRAEAQSKKRQPPTNRPWAKPTTPPYTPPSVWATPGPSAVTYGVGMAAPTTPPSSNWAAPGPSAVTYGDNGWNKTPY